MALDTGGLCIWTGSLTHIWSRASRHRRPSASDVQAAGGLERNRFGLITVSLQAFLARMVVSKACKFSRSCSGRNDGDGRHAERRKKTGAVSCGGAIARVQPSVVWSYRPEGKRATLRRGNIHVQLS